MVAIAKEVGPQRFRESFGRYYEDFTPGDVYEHRPGPHDLGDRQHLVHTADDEHAPAAFRRRLCGASRSSGGRW